MAVFRSTFLVSGASSGVPSLAYETAVLLVDHSDVLKPCVDPATVVLSVNNLRYCLNVPFSLSLSPAACGDYRGHRTSIQCHILLSSFAYHSPQPLKRDLSLCLLDEGAPAGYSASLIS